MEQWMQVMGGGLLCAVAAVVLRQWGRESALPLQSVGLLLLTGAGWLLLQPVLGFAGELAASCGVAEEVSLLLRGLGVATVTQLCADLCRQFGEATLAQGVELAGRAQILLLALPWLRELVARSSEWLQGAGGWS